jgi:hypothetical protein
MFDDMLVECISAEILFGSKQPKLLPWNEPKKRSFPRADRAVAVRDLREFTLNLKGDISTMTATSVNHYAAPVNDCAFLALVYYARLHVDHFD